MRRMICAVGLCAAAWAQTEVYVRSYDGAHVAAAMRKPPGDGPLPAILFIHGGVGGSTMQAMKNFTTQKVPEHFFRLGYVVLSTDYRRYHFGEDEIQDVLAAYRTLASDPAVDKERIGVIGGSHGGYLAKMLATRIRPAAVVSFAGLCDIEDMFYEHAQVFRRSIAGFDDWRAKLMAGRMGSNPPASRRDLPAPGTAPYEVAMDLAWRFGDRRELYRAISPTHNAEKITSPVLYVAGSRDYLREYGKPLMEALRARSVVAEYSEHEGMPHGFYWGQGEKPPQQFHDALRVTAAFVEKHAGRRAAGPR